MSQVYYGRLQGMVDMGAATFHGITLPETLTHYEIEVAGVSRPVVHVEGETLQQIGLNRFVFFCVGSRFIDIAIHGGNSDLIEVWVSRRGPSS